MTTLRELFSVDLDFVSLYFSSDFHNIFMDLVSFPFSSQIYPEKKLMHRSKVKKKTIATNNDQKRQNYEPS